MKKVFILLLASSIVFLSCLGSNGIKVTNNSVETATGKSNELIFNSAQCIVDTISQYIDLSEYINSDFRSVNGDVITFEEFARLLPSEAGDLRRFSGEGSERSADCTEISLVDELRSIVENYYTKLESIMPDPSAAMKLDFVSIEDGVLYVSDDYGIPLKTPEGIATIEILNAYANGDDVDALIAQIEKESFNIENDCRGLWLASIKPWNNGEVNYRWGLESDITEDRKQSVKKLYEMSDVNKKATIAAMNKWNEVTKGVVSFKELERNLFTDVFSAINLIRVIYIFDADYKSDTTHGMSTVCNSGIYTLKKNLFEENLERTPLHELGHVLGLIHEHQRFDRDLYLDFSKIPNVDLENVNYKKYPKDVDKIAYVWKWVPAQIAFIRFTMLILTPVVKSEAYSYVTGETLDFDSIMLYNWIPVKTQYKKFGRYSPGYGYYITKDNEQLSDNDINAVMEIYKK